MQLLPGDTRAMHVPLGPTRTRSYLYHNSDYRPEPLRMVVLRTHFLLGLQHAAGAESSGCVISGHPLRGFTPQRSHERSTAQKRAAAPPPEPGKPTAVSSRPALRPAQKKPRGVNERSAAPPAPRAALPAATTGNSLRDLRDGTGRGGAAALSGCAGPGLREAVRGRCSRGANFGREINKLC